MLYYYNNDLVIVVTVGSTGRNRMVKTKIWATFNETFCQGPFIDFLSFRHYT